MIKSDLKKRNWTFVLYNDSCAKDWEEYLISTGVPFAYAYHDKDLTEIGEKKKAKETFDFVLKTVGKHSFLGEQVDNSTLKPNWVIGLGWSHAMFIIVLEKLSNIK